MSAEVRSVVVKLSMENSQYIAAAIASGDAQVTAMGKAKAATMSQGQAIDSLGGKAGKIGLVAAAGLGLMAKAAMDWETQWAGVTKTVDGTGAQLNELEGDLRDLATSLPATHEEIAAVAEAAGQLGVARKDISTFTKTMIDLGETTNLTADQAATDIAQISNVMGTTTDDVDNFGSALVALGNDGASTEAQILSMAQRIAGAGAQIGLTESDILAIANAAASMGIEVEAGGSAISRVFTDMAKATAQGGAELDKFAAVAGLTSTEFATAFRDDPAQAFAAFTGGLDRINKSGGDVFTTLDDLRLSDVRVSQALLGMAASGDLLTDSLALGADAWSENTALADEAAKRYDTTAAKTQVAWNKIKDAGIEAGGAVLPVVAAIADGVGDMAGAFGALPGPVQGAVTKLLAVTAVLGGAAWFGAKTIGGIASTRQALGDLGVTAGQSRVLLASVGKGLQFAAIGLAVTTLTDQIAALANTRVEGDITRNLTALSDGRVVGNMDSLGNSLSDFSSDWVKNWSKVDTIIPFQETEYEEAAAQIKGVDDALASMVESGNVEGAKAAFEQIVTIGAESGVSAADTAKAFEQYSLALENVAPAALIAAGSTGELSGATSSFIGPVSAAVEAENDLAAALKDATAEMQRKTSATLAAFDAETAYRQALKAAKAQGDKTNAGIRGNSEAALANRQAISSLAGAWNGQSNAVKNNVSKFREARRSFIDTAVSMGVPIDKARELARSMLDIPKSRVIKVTAETAGAVSQIQSVKGFLDSIPRTVTSRVVVTRSTGNGGRSTAGGIPIDSADGGSVPKTGLPYADRHPYMLADGEEVISNRNGQADRHRGLLKAINANRLADGGTTGRSRDNGTLVGVDIYGSLRSLKRAFEESEKAVDRERTKRDSLTSRRDEIRSGITSGLGGGDMWAGASNPWADGATNNPTDYLNQQTAGAEEFTRLVKKLKGAGLDGAALAEVIGSGDLERARMMASLSSRDLGQFERAYNTNQKAVQTASAAGGQAVMGQQIAAQNRIFQQELSELRAIKSVLRANEKAADKSRKNAAKETVKGVNGAAGDGKRDRVYAGSR